MKKKVIISLAAMEAGAPLNYDALAADIVKSVSAGAAMCHLHARDEHGSMTADCDPMIDCFKRARENCDFVIQASTGGVSDLTMEQRCHPLDYDVVESCSLNGGSTNLGEYVYRNSFEDIRYVSRKAYECNVLPEIEVFDIGMIQAVEGLARDVPFREPKFYNLVFGHKGGMQPTMKNLVAFSSFVPAGSPWGVTHFGRAGWDFLAGAIALGATEVRIGFEDSRDLGNGESATENWQLVKRLRELVEAIGYEVAGPHEAREILGIA